MTSSTACLNCHFNIQCHDLTSDFRLLDVRGYDVILGPGWIYTHSSVGLDLRRRDFSICKNGGPVATFTDGTIQQHNQVISTKKLCQLLKKNAVRAVIILNNSKTGQEETIRSTPAEIQSVVSEFEDLFQEPKKLPPARGVDHITPLIDDTKTVN